MKLNIRLSLLMALLTLLPAVPTAWVTNELIRKSLDIGLNPRIDGALDAGVRRAREQLLDQREMLAADLQSWAATRTEWLTDETELRSWLDRGGRPELPEADRVALSGPPGTEILLQEGGIEAVTNPSDPPSTVQAQLDLGSGWTIRATRLTAPEWREDAELLASTLQVVRGLGAEREQLENVFWMPFLIIYGIALALGLALAARLGYGITEPVGRLLRATREVSKGNWAVQVAVRGRDEIASLGRHFNEMVRTLDAQNRNLVDLEKMAGWREMARALAHEVKNPLTPIQLTVEEMRVRYGGEDPAYKKLVEECTRIVVEEVKGLRDVVARFREFSRPVEPRMQPVDLNQLLRDIAAMQKDLRIELDLEEDIGMIEADEVRLRQLLMNLTQNARTATRDVSEPRLLLSSKRHGDDVVVRIEDNGPGIPVGDRDRIFEPYRSGSVGGLGLGLALVKGIVLAHQGTIEVEDGSLGGACMRFRLPRHHSQQDSRAKARSEATHE